MPHLIVFSHLRWDGAHRRPLQLLSRLARHWPVLFVEEPVRGMGGEPCLEAIGMAPGVTVLRLVHGPAGAGGFTEEALSALRPLLAGRLRAQGVDDCIAWFYTPMAVGLLDVLSPRAVVYDCTDDLAALPGAPAQMRGREAALLDAADLVLTAGPSLFERLKASHRHVLCVPGGVDTSWHVASQPASARLAAMLQAEHVQGRISGPRLGFFGTIDARVDLALLDAMATAEPTWQLLMAGSIVGIDEARLPRHPNIHWLGPQPPTLLPHLATDWEVCLLPYVTDETTRCLNPAQTLEYMAAEKPIVSSALHDVVAMFGDVVRFGHDPQSFIDACRWALFETGHKRAERIGDMLATVSRFSWDGAADAVADALHALLAVTPVSQPQPAAAPDPVARAAA